MTFPNDFQLEQVDAVFAGTKIKRLVLPHSIRKIDDVFKGLLVNIILNNEHFKSNEEGTAILSQDGKELISVSKAISSFVIPFGVRVIKRRAFSKSIIKGVLIIPSSEEVIEEEAFIDCATIRVIEFAEGSRLRSLAFNSFFVLHNLIINNENFVKREDVVVISLNPRGIVFVPKELTEIEIDPGVEVIYSRVFSCKESRAFAFQRGL